MTQTKKTSQIFFEKSNLIHSDPRKDRYEQYNVNADFMTKRHAALFPEHIIRGKRILDLGCCVAGSAGWFFEHGAVEYAGVEINAELCKAAEQNLKEYYSDRTWKIFNLSIEEYFVKYIEQRYDLIFYGGIIYSNFDWIEQLTALTKISDHIVIETIHPDIAAYVDDEQKTFKKFLLSQPKILDKMENTAAFVYLKQINGPNGDQNTLLSFGAVPSMGALKQQMERLSYEYDTTCNQELQKSIPEWYHPTGRFGIHFYKKENIDTNYLTVEELYKKSTKRKQRLVPWKTFK